MRQSGFRFCRSIRRRRAVGLFGRQRCSCGVFSRGFLCLPVSLWGLGHFIGTHGNLEAVFAFVLCSSQGHISLDHTVVGTFPSEVKNGFFFIFAELLELGFEFLR